MESREHQVIMVDRLIEEVSSKRKVLGQSPTGSGKTVIFSLICQRYIRNTGKSVLILVHRQELLKQAHDTIKDILGIEAYVIDSKTKRFAKARVYIGMVESMKSRTHLFDNVGLVIIDECHIAVFNKVHHLFLEESIIGFTATPKSTSKLEPLSKYYSSIVCGLQINELIKLEYLAQNITRCPKDIVDQTKLEIDSRKGDFNENIMAGEFRKPKFVFGVAKTVKRYCKGKTIIFNVNIQHSLDVTHTLENMDYNVRHLDASDTNKPSTNPMFANKREETLHWFKVTEDAILCNVMIATAGFDEPTIQNVIINYSTLSIVKFLQCCGRGGRRISQFVKDKLQHRYPYELQEKTHFNIIDLGGNCVRFGDWNDDRDWDYIFNNPEKPGDGIAPKKTCPKCEGLVHASSMKCGLLNANNEICDYEFQRRPEAKEADIEEMILITKGVNLDMLIDKNKRKYDYYTFLELGHDVVEKMYKDYNIVNDTVLLRYFDIYYELCKKWYNKALAGKNGNVSDISNSGWHIRLAKNNFDKLVEQLKPDLIECPQCGTFIATEEAKGEFGLCEDCNSEQERFTQSENYANRGY